MKALLLALQAHKEMLRHMRAQQQRQVSVVYTAAKYL